MANGSYEGHLSSEKNRKVRGSFLFLDQTKENKLCGGEKEIGKRKKWKKRKRKERKRKEMRGKQNQCVGKEKKRDERREK